MYFSLPGGGGVVSFKQDVYEITLQMVILW